MSPFRAGLVFSAARMLTSSFSFIYLLDRGLSVSEVSTARVVQLIALVVLEVPCGALADRLGPRWSLLAATLASSLWLGSMALVVDMPTLITAELLNAISLSLFSGSFEVLLRDTHQAKNPVANFGKFQSLWIAGASVLGALFATLVSRQAAWLLAAVIQVALVVLLWRDARRPQPDSSTSLTSARNGDLVLILRTIRSLPASLFFTFTAPTLVYDILLQFWQPIIVLVGVSSENNLVLVLFSLSIMMAMSMGSALEEIAARRWLIPAVIVTAMVAIVGMAMTGGIIRLVLTLAVICMLILVVTALRSRATFQLVNTVRGDVEIATLSVVSAIARILSGLVILLVGTSLNAADSVLLLVFTITILTGICFLAGRAAERTTD